MLKMTTFCGIAALVLAPAAHAAPGPSPLQDLIACAKAPDDAAQLACYRAAAAALEQAQARSEIVIVSRADVRAVRRQAFGLTLPSLSLFDAGGAEPEPDVLAAQVRAARQDAAGRWIVQLDSGATWAQVETTPLRLAPKAGMPVTIGRAALGSYKMKLGDQTAVRAKRIE